MILKTDLSFKNTGRAVIPAAYLQKAVLFHLICSNDIHIH